LTKSLSCNVAALTMMPYISESSDIQRLFLQYRKGLNMTSISVISIKKAISRIQEDSAQFTSQKKSDPSLPFGRHCKASGRSSISNFRSDVVAIPYGHPSMSRSFKLFKVASIQT